MQVDGVFLAQHARVQIIVEAVEGGDALSMRDVPLCRKRTESLLHVHHESKLIHFVKLTAHD